MRPGIELVGDMPGAAARDAFDFVALGETISEFGVDVFKMSRAACFRPKD
jgi:hypothetical protein